MIRSLILLLNKDKKLIKDS